MLRLELLQDFDKSNNNEMEFGISDNIYIYIRRVTEFQAKNTFLNEQPFHPCHNQVTSQIK